MASTRLSKTFSGNGDRQKFTFSAWIKRTTTSQSFLWTSGSYSSSSMTQWLFDNDGTLGLYDYNSSGSVLSNVVTNRKFRDTSAWYHIVIRVDTTQSTAADRIRIYVNGVQETSFSATNYPGQNDNYIYSESITAQYIGQRADQGNTSSFEGLMTHIHWTDGYSYDASSFGETDSTSGIWKPKTAPSVTYGTNGFFLKFENSGNLDLDSSGNNLTFATSGTLTQNVDTPSNNFCTISPLDNMNASNTTIPGKLENGNLSFINNDSNQIYTRGSIGVKSGKYYWEAKQGSGTAWAIGIMVEAMLTQTNNQFWDTTTVTGVAANGSSNTLYINGGSGDSWNTGITVSASSIYGFALDVDNRALYIHHNGTYLTANSAVGDPTSGSSRTGSVLGELTTRGGTGGLNYIPENEYIYPFQGDLSTSNSTNLQMNFGSGYFATTAISSEGSNASGLGKFEYNVPAGYTALCTKGLNE